MNEKSPASAALDEVKRLLGMIFSEFTYEGEPAAADKSIRVRVTDTFPVPPLARIALAVGQVGVLMSPQDKERWRVGFGFRGVACAIIHSKHGVWIEAASSDETLVADIVIAVRKAVRVVETRLLEPVARQQLLEGSVTAANDYARIRGMYRHFRRTTEGLLAGQLVPLPPAEPKTVVGPTDMPEGALDFLDTITESMGRRSQALYNQVAAIVAYFSMLEHVLFLLTAFQPTSVETPDIRAAIGRSWSDKWTFVFPLTSPASKAHYDALHRIAETHRNFYSHGGHGRGGTTLYFHFPSVGAMPMTMSHSGEQRTFNVWASEAHPLDEEVAQLWAAFDAVDKFIANGSMRLAMTYIDAGLDVRFDAKARSEFAAAATSDETFDAWLELQAIATAHFDNFE